MSHPQFKTGKKKSSRGIKRKSINSITIDLGPLPSLAFTGVLNSSRIGFIADIERCIGKGLTSFNVDGISFGLQKPKQGTYVKTKLSKES